jgi:hypothetical protein
MTHQTKDIDQLDQAVAKIKDLMDKPISFYNSPRQANEMDLVGLVRDRLIQSGLLEKIDHYDSSRFIIEAKDKPSHAQQYLLNRYLSTQLMAAPEDTSIERYALIYEIQPDQWLEIFDKTILPTVVNCNLPVRI